MQDLFHDVSNRRRRPFEPLSRGGAAGLDGPRVAVNAGKGARELKKRPEGRLLRLRKP
jgi:hypothetical protein